MDSVDGEIDWQDDEEEAGDSEGNDSQKPTKMNHRIFIITYRFNSWLFLNGNT